MDVLQETARSFGRELSPEEIEDAMAAHLRGFVRTAVAGPEVTAVLDDDVRLPGSVYRCQASYWLCEDKLLLPI